MLSHLEYCAPSHLSLLDRVVLSAERFCENELCYLRHRRKVRPSCLLYKIYHRAGHPLHEYLQDFIAAYNTRDSAALCELALVIPRCRTDKFSLSFLPVTVRLLNLLPSLSVCKTCFSGGTLRSFKSAMNLCLQRAWHDFFPLLISVSFCCLIDCLVSWFWARSYLYGVFLFVVLCAR